jgi:hypothetical protein
VSDAFEAWVRSLGGGVSDDARALLRQIFDKHGAVARDEADRIGREHQIGLAGVAVRRLGHDLAATTDLKPPPFRYIEENGSVRVAYWGQFATNPIMGLRQPAVTVEVADFIQDETMEVLHAPWPVCPTHRAGVRPMRSGDQAVWVCGSADHHLAVIGTLSAGKGER